MSSVLIVGGTGPTGFALAERLHARGDGVTIVHTGAHEVLFSGQVEHLHADPGRLKDLVSVLGRRTFDHVISTSGRLRYVVETLEKRAAKLVAVTGCLRTPGGGSSRGSPDIRLIAVEGVGPGGASVRG